MSPACSGTSEHHFLCSICLEVLTDPVTTPCGHNFCKTCISTHWDTSTTSRCPVCNQVFSTKPQLKVNIMMQVLCDVCTRTKVKALKSCLDCVISYCETHLDKPLELFCQSDQTRVCLMCSVLEHKSHQLVPLGEDLGLKELMKTMEEQQEAEEREAEGLIKELEEEIFELMKRSSEVEQLSHSEDHLLQDFCSLKAPPATKDWTEVMVHPSSHEGTVLRAVAQLEDTLSDEMMKIKMLEMKRLQQFAVDVTLDSLTAHPYLVLSDDEKLVYFSNVKKNLPHNKERFSYCACVLGKQNFSSGRFYFEVQVKGKTKWYLGVAKESINRKGKITLTPKNGYWTVALRDGNVYESYEDHSVILHLKCVPEKVGVFVDYEEGVVSFYDVDAAALIYSFTHCCFTHKLHPFFCPSLSYGGKNSVLCSTGLTGHCYWEVERKGNVYIAVSYRGISRKGYSKDCVFGFNNQSWSLKCSRGFYTFRHNNIITHTSCRCGSSGRVGVYVDCPDGRLSFYKVSSDSMTLIHTVCTSFTDTLYPGFGFWFGSSVSLSPL
uniref:E3 ubiquitin-protein ligase TRIM41-like n=1 Tax=Gouania willdenowi TaxID=441366 RepID=A0A8C5GR80_GOUWI